MVFAFSPGFVSLTKIRAFGGRVPFSSFTTPRKVAFPKARTTRTPVNCSPSFSSIPRCMTVPSRSIRAMLNPFGGNGFDTEPSEMFAIPPGKPIN